MQSVIVMTLALVSQTMQFRNDVEGERFTVRIYCRSHQRWEKTFSVPVGATASVKLHTGRFLVSAKNSKGQRDQSERKLAEGELDRMVLTELYSGPQRVNFEIGEYYEREEPLDEDLTDPRE